MHDLVGMRTTQIQTDGDGFRTVVGDSLYQVMSDSIQGLIRDQDSAAGWRSVPPVWTECSEWLRDVDVEVKAWWSDGTGVNKATVNRLHALLDHAWGPDDVDQLRGYTDHLIHWTRNANTLLDGDLTHKWELRAPCPACGTRTHLVEDSTGERIRQFALQVDQYGATCGACKYTWGRSYFEHLALTIGCETPAGVLE